MRTLIALTLVTAACGGSRKLAYSPESRAVSPATYAAIADTGGEPAPTAEHYTDYGKNPWVDAKTDHLSTFAADVDTASYSLARRALQSGSLPAPASVRPEEFVNYFKYSFAAPVT